MAEPTLICKTCGDLEVVRPDGRGFPPDIAERRLAKRCKARGHASDPRYYAGLSFGCRRGAWLAVSPMSDLTTEVRAALAAATPGPWEQSRGFPAIVYGADRNDIYSRPREEIERNVHLIASAPSWLAALCDRLDAAEAELTAVKAALSPHATEAHGCTRTECPTRRRRYEV